MNLNEYMKEKKLRDEDVATQVGVTREHLNKLKNGKSAPSLLVALKIREISGGVVEVEGWV